jgi:hypothetical protein
MSTWRRILPDSAFGDLVDELDGADLLVGRHALGDLLAASAVLGARPAAADRPAATAARRGRYPTPGALVLILGTLSGLCLLAVIVLLNNP